jgi:hypothetical protein
MNQRAGSRMGEAGGRDDVSCDDDYSHPTATPTATAPAQTDSLTLLSVALVSLTGKCRLRRF